MKKVAGLFLIICMMFFISSCANTISQKNNISDKSEASLRTFEKIPEEGFDVMFDYMVEENAKLLYMGQASSRITTVEGKVIYIDPYVGDGYEPAADLILVTHSHYDHNGVEIIENRNPDCQIINLDEAAECAELVKARHNIPYHVIAQDGVYFDRERAEQFEAENRLIVGEGEEISSQPTVQ